VPATPTPYHSRAALIIRDPVGQVFQELERLGRQP